MIFHEGSHSYYNGKEKYQGVTSLIGKYEKFTDWVKVSENYVKKKTRRELLKDLATKWKITYKQAEAKWGKDEFTGEWIRSVWADKSERALAGGNFYHNWAEIRDSEDAFYNPIVNGKKELLDLEILVDGTYLELGIFSHKYKVCGQADKIELKGKEFKVIDYKTNAEKPEPKPKTYYDKASRSQVTKRFLAPISHIDENKYHVYALQLSIYAHMLELYGYTCLGLEVQYIDTEFKHPMRESEDDLVIFREPEFERIRVVTEVIPIELPYLKEEAKAILKHNMYA